MASNVVQNENGTYVRDPAQGYWRKATPEELTYIQQGPVEAFGQSFANNMKMGAQTAGLLFSPRGKSGILRQLGETAERQGQLSRFQEQPAAAGTAAALVADPLNFLLPGAGKAGETVAERVAVKTAQRVAQETARTGAVAGTKAGTVTGGSAGAAAVNTPRGLRGLLDLIFEPGELSPQARALIPVGDRIGFQFLPGQREGNRLFLDSLQSHPITAQAFSFELGANADLLRNLVVRALGVDGTDAATFTRDILRLSRQQVGQRFEQVRGALDDAGVRLALPDDDVALLQEMAGTLTPAQRRAINLGDMDGAQAFELRSRLNQRTADLYANGERTAAGDLEEVIERLDQQIADTVGPDMMETWRTARQQWRVRLALKKPGVITPDGDVSLKQLSRYLEKGFEREFGEVLIPDEAFRASNPAIADLMDFVRVARTFESNLPDSGTATRQTIGRILGGNWKEIATASVVRKLIEGTARFN